MAGPGGGAGEGRSRGGASRKRACAEAGPSWAGPRAGGGAGASAASAAASHSPRPSPRQPESALLGSHSGPLCPSEGHQCPQETNTDDRTIQPQAPTQRRLLRPHPHAAQLRARSQTPSAVVIFPLLAIPPHKGCAHTDPSGPRHVDTDSSVVITKTGSRSSAHFPVEETEAQRVKELAQRHAIHKWQGWT